ncbi:MAG TPA: hypothetical protein VF650_06155 [Allosphingosinicella sp.]|jgi:hypothetical protein
MPRYFFQVEDGEPPREAEAVELKDLSVAKCEAVKLAGQTICAQADSFWDREEWRLTASNEQGLTLFCLHFVGIDAPAANRRRDPERACAGPD